MLQVVADALAVCSCMLNPQLWLQLVDGTTQGWPGLKKLTGNLGEQAGPPTE